MALLRELGNSAAADHPTLTALRGVPRRGSLLLGKSSWWEKGEQVSCLKIEKGSPTPKLQLCFEKIPNHDFMALVQFCLGPISHHHR